MQDYILPIALTGLFIWGVVLYMIIKAAVKSAIHEANAELLINIKLMNQFKTRELLKDGVSQEEINRCLDNVTSN